jgi:hypothetical protein
VVPLEGEAQGQREATPLDDDGFESLNGNASSDNGEEVIDNGEEGGSRHSKIAEDLSAQNRSSLNRTSSVQKSGSISSVGKAQNERNRSTLNYSDRRSEKSLQDVKLSVPVVHITEHNDILRELDEQELIIESGAHVECLKNDTCTEEAARVLGHGECSETKCSEPEQTANKNIQKSVVSWSGKCDNESGQKKVLIDDKEHMRLSESSAEEQCATFRNSWIQDVTSFRSPGSDTNHADSDTDITDPEIGSRSPQVIATVKVLLLEFRHIILQFNVHTVRY